MITSRNDRFFKGGFIRLMIAAAVFCGASAVACGEVMSEGDVKALFPEGARVARTIRPEGTGFSFAPGRQEYRPLSDDYRVFINGREAEVRACRESPIPFNRYWPGRQRPLDQSERASYLALEAQDLIPHLKPNEK